MEFFATAKGKMGLRHISPLLADLLREIPHCLKEDSELEEARLFPSPNSDPDEEQLREDWKAYVEPELHEWFLSARQVVEADLRSMKEREGGYMVEIPYKHAEAWMNAVNQARLVLAARYQFDERELRRAGPMPIQSERDYALLQMGLYEALLAWLVEVLDAEER